jgi:hypothetical protein
MHIMKLYLCPLWVSSSEILTYCMYAPVSFSSASGYPLGVYFWLRIGI